MKRPISGLTFIELLLALGIFSIVAVTISSAFAAGIRIHRRATDVNLEERDARWILNLVTKDLENAVYYNFENSDSEKTAFDGNPDEIRFLTATSAGLKVVRYSLTTPEKARMHQTVVGKHFAKLKSVLVFSRNDQEEGLFFIREEAGLPDFFQKDSFPAQDILTKSIKREGLAFSFAYREGPLESPQIVWLDRWKEKTVPVGVWVKLTFVSRQKQMSSYQIEKKIFIPTGSWEARPQ